MKDLHHLLGMTMLELTALAESLGQPGYRGRQIADWIYKRNVSSIQEMANLPAAFRERLESSARLYRSRVAGSSKSADGTTKLLLELEDGQRIEAVLLPYEDRVSVCVSSQVGCAAACAFCATGMGGFCRNLKSGEILDEVLTLQREIPRRISHVVFMGMGEPLLNYDSVMAAVKILNGEMGIAMRHITISTVGITPGIERLAKEHLQLTLAVSLHAPSDSLRRELIPLARRYPLDKLISACRDYANTTGRRVTFEYILIQGVNDSPSHAAELALLLRGVLAAVNLIPYNAVPGLDFKRSSDAAVRKFRRVLEERGITVSQRAERGRSVSAACGQLRRRAAE